MVREENWRVMGQGMGGAREGMGNAMEGGHGMSEEETTHNLIQKTTVISEANDECMKS